MIIGSVIALMTVIVSIYVIPFIKSKMSKEEWDAVLEFAMVAVRAAEQLYDSNTEKAEYVREYVADKLMETGLSFTTDDVKLIHEAAVNAVKYGMEYTRKDK